MSTANQELYDSTDLVCGTKASTFLAGIYDFKENQEKLDSVHNELNKLSGFKLRSDPTKAAGVKYDSDKRDWSLLPLNGVEQVIDVLMFGAKKYAPDNWKHVDNANIRYYNAAMRHIVAWKQGQHNDIETGISHLAHATCCLLFILSMETK
jgi:hypothetical protein